MRQTSGFSRAHALIAVLAVSAGSYGAVAQDSDGATTLRDCEQTDSAPLVVRACTALLNTKLEPAERVRLLFLRATGWMKEDEFQAAADDYTAILDIEKDSVKALEGRGKANQKGAHYIDAAADWTRLIAIDSGNEAYFRQRGEANLGAREYQQALDDFETSITLKRDAMQSYIGRAKVYSAMGDIEQSKREFERGIAVNDRYIPLFWTRGEMAYEWGDKDLAIASYRRVLALNGVYEDARRRLQRLGIMHPP